MQRSTEKIVMLTPLAIERVKQFIAKDKSDAKGLRVFVMAGGCSGYQYGMVLEKEAKAEDIAFEDSGISVYVDAQSARLLSGSKIDFVDTVQGSGFKISNPNVMSSCSCGNSFSTTGSRQGHHHHGEEEGFEDEEREAEGGCACGCGGH